jgi:hypothetical protein
VLFPIPFSIFVPYQSLALRRLTLNSRKLLSCRRLILLNLRFPSPIPRTRTSASASRSTHLLQASFSIVFSMLNVYMKQGFVKTIAIRSRSNRHNIRNVPKPLTLSIPLNTSTTSCRITCPTFITISTIVIHVAISTFTINKLRHMLSVM